MHQDILDKNQIIFRSRESLWWLLRTPLIYKFFHQGYLWAGLCQFPTTLTDTVWTGLWGNRDLQSKFLTDVVALAPGLLYDDTRKLFLSAASSPISPIQPTRLISIITSHWTATKSRSLFEPDRLSQETYQF
jgi:hypothetical protein